MEDMYAEKLSFVMGPLNDMVRAATRGWVHKLDYERVGQEEVVVIHTPTAVFDVNVTADSLWAISKDVMKALADRY